MNLSPIEPLEARIAPATISIANAPAVTEGNSGKVTATFTVSLAAAATEDFTVAFATAAGTAVSSGAFADFVAQNGTLSFATGDLTKEISVEVNGDVFNEADQTFTVTLSNPTGSNTIDTATATGTITNDDTAAIVSIAPAADATEGAGATSVFNVTLSHAVETPVTVNFATGVTADTARPGPGLFTDYVTKTGTLTFAAGGALSQPISVAITDDTFKEDTEQFTVTLSAANGGTLGTAVAVGKILNDTDTSVGLRLLDARVVEGATAGTATITATLSGKLATALTFATATQNGTAAAGADFTATAQSVTIAANQLTTTFTVPIINSAAFETVESFYVNATGLPSNVTAVNDHPVNPAAQLSAKVTILDDDIGVVSAKELRWTDIDGDLVTLTVSKGSLVNLLGQPNSNLVTFLSKGTLGGRELLGLNLNQSAFSGANVTLTATKQLGFPEASDGRVNMGVIQAASFISSELQVRGTDLGVVTIDGDLSKITAGDQFSTPAIRKLDVYSLGANPAIVADLKAQSGDANATNFEFIQSDVLGPITTVNVATNVEGFLHVIGAEFGTIGTLNIKGALKGGADENSGRVTASGRIAKATLGSIIGSTGLNSGLLSGTNLTDGVLGSVTVLGDVVGGSGDSSGTIFSSLNLASVTIKGSLRGGSGSGSGGVVAGGTIAKLVIDGNVTGGNSADDGNANTDDFLNQSGFISATKLTNVTIGGDVTAGKDVIRKGVASSGSIRADVITSLVIEGDVIGHQSDATGDPTVPVIISAGGQTNLLAIKSLKILGSARDLEILAGYSGGGVATSTTGVIQRGNAINADASIGSIEIGTGLSTDTIARLNIVAGGQPGTTGRFGEATNTVIKAVSGESLNSFGAVSQIASVLLKGTIETNADIYGIVAQTIGSVKFGPAGASTVALTAGASNDLVAKVIGTATKFQVVELKTDANSL